MNLTKRIGFDIDGVVARTVDSYIKMQNMKYPNNKLSVEDIISYSTTEQFKFTLDEYRWIHQNAGVYEETKDVINILYNEGYKIHMVTARGGLSNWDYPEVLQDTFDWFEDNEIGCNTFSFGKDKAERSKFLRLDCLVEDAIPYVDDFKDSETELIILDRPWNQSKSGNYTRIYDIKELYELINNETRG